MSTTPVGELSDRALLTLEEARLYCFRNAGDASRDELLLAAVNDVSDEIADYTGREFVMSTGHAALAAPIDDNDVTFDVTGAVGLPSSATFLVRIDDEVLLVTAVAGDTWTVTRAQNGTTAAAHIAGALVAELEARTFQYAGAGFLDLEPYDLRELATVTLYTDLDASLHDELASTAYRLDPTGGFPGSGTYLGLRVPYPAIEEAAFGFGWQATVVGRWGMAAIPGGVKLAAKIWVDNLVRNPAAAASHSMNGYTIVPELDTDERRAGMPPAARYRLERWIRPGHDTAGRPAHGVTRFSNAGAGDPPAIPNTLPTP